MTRAQILLEPWQYQFLGSLAQKENKSISQLVREWIEGKAKERLGRRSADSILDIDGLLSEAPATMAEHHDAYLYGHSRSHHALSGKFP